MLKSATMVPDTVGCAAKYWEPSKPFSSPVTERNTIERFGFVPESHRPSNFNQRCVTRGVVHRAIVDAVAVHRLTDPEVIEVRANHDIFLLEFWIAARENSNHVLGFRFRAGHSDARMNLHNKGKVRQRFLCV